MRDVVLEALAGELFNDKRGDGRTGVAIGHAGSGWPARDARVVIVVEAFTQRHALGVFGVLVQMQIVPAGGVFEQVDDADGVSGFPAILEIDLRDQLVHRVLQREFAFIHQLEDGERDEGLGGGADAKEGVSGGGLIGGDVRFAEARYPLGTLAMNDSDGHARGVGVVKDLFQLLAELRDRLRRLGFGLRLFLGNEGWGKQAKDGGEADG